MAISAQLVKQLRDETDAPIMEAKAALQEANGDFDKAKDILREKGKAAAQKRAGRSTSEGVAKVVVSDDGKKLVALVVECETDFVAKNEDFIKTVDSLANGMLAAGAAGPEVQVDGKAVSDHIEEAVGKIRENIQLKTAVFESATDGIFVAYNHHDNKKSAYVNVSGDGEGSKQLGYKMSVQIVALRPQFVSRDEVPAEYLAKELEIQTQRAVNEGKPAEVAGKIAEGRLNKEVLSQIVMMDQPYYADTKVSVGEWISQNSEMKDLKILGFRYIGVGEE